MIREKIKINKKISKYGDARKIILFLMIFFIGIFVMWCAPLCSDDYEFLGLQMNTNKEILHYALYYGNGRFLGNLGIVYLLKIQWLGVLVRALGIASICMLIPHVLGCNDLKTYLLSTILVVTLSPSLFSEVYTWASGFQNYIPPIWITLIILWLIKWNNKKVKIEKIYKIFMIMVVFILGISSQLYVEHSTIVNNFISLSFILYSIKKRWKFSKIMVCDWAIANGIGTIFMIIIPKIFYIEKNRVTGYRKINNDSVMDLINSCKMNGLLLAGKMQKNFGGFIVLVIIGLALLIIFRNKLEKKKIILTFWIYIFSIIYMGLNNLYLSKISIEGHLNALKLMLDVLAILFIVLATIIIIYNLRIKRVLYLNIYLMLLMFVSLAPLLIVSLLPERTIYQSYIFFVGIVLVNFEYMISLFTKNIQKTLSIILGIAIIGISIFLIVKFADIHRMDNNRTQNIQMQLNNREKIIKVHKIPSKYVFWDGEWMFSRYYCKKNYGDVLFKEIK